jgi:hypothetical protein
MPMYPVCAMRIAVLASNSALPLVYLWVGRRAYRGPPAHVGFRCRSGGVAAHLNHSVGTAVRPPGQHMGTIGADNLQKAHTLIESNGALGNIVLEDF